MSFENFTWMERSKVLALLKEWKVLWKICVSEQIFYRKQSLGVPKLLRTTTNVNNGFLHEQSYQVICISTYNSDDISGSAPYYGLCEKAPPKCGTFFTIQEYELIWKVKDLTSCSIQLKGSNRCSLWLFFFFSHLTQHENNRSTCSHTAACS